MILLPPNQRSRSFFPNWSAPFLLQTPPLILLSRFLMKLCFSSALSTVVHRYHCLSSDPNFLIWIFSKPFPCSFFFRETVFLFSLFLYFPEKYKLFLYISVFLLKTISYSPLYYWIRMRMYNILNLFHIYLNICVSPERLTVTSYFLWMFLNFWLIFVKISVLLIAISETYLLYIYLYLNDIIYISSNYINSILCTLVIQYCKLWRRR